MNIKIKLALVALLSLSLFACDVLDDDNDTNSGKPQTQEPGSITEVASSDDRFDTLVAALTQSGLDDALADETKTYTVFAPTDAAFDMLGQEAIDALLADSDKLSDVLLYHVRADQKVEATAAIGLAGSKITMANGDEAALSLSGQSLYVNNAMVISTDIEASNGVIHVLDAVLMPPKDMGMPSDNIVETAIAAGNFTKLIAALEAAGLDGALANESETYTVFAPTDAAFEMVGEANLNALLNDADALDAILKQHVVSGVALSSIDAYAANGSSVVTLSDAEVDIAISNGMLTVGGAVVSMTDIYASNGVIHVIDSVIVGDVELPQPPQTIVDLAVEDDRFTTLVELLQTADLVGALSNSEASFTVFAPTNDAFAKIETAQLEALKNDASMLADVLTYHVLDSEVLADAALGLASSDMPMVEAFNGDKLSLSTADSTLFVNASNVTQANLMGSNGVIHVIDTVLMPPKEKMASSSTITEIAVAEPELSQLVDLLSMTGLDALLNDDSQTFTVFAPLNSAFAKIDSATLNTLLMDTSTDGDLYKILTYHVVSGAEADALTAYTLNGKTVTTLGGEQGVMISNGQLMVGGATVVTTDIYASNGVIHLIDTVITDTYQAP